MVCFPTWLGNREEPVFEDPPWDENSPQWKRIDNGLGDGHVARRIVQAMKMLDLDPLFASYSRSGSRPIRPDLMLAICLIEIHGGERSPGRWHEDAFVDMSLQWAGFGIKPSRSTWYNFRDRLGPLLNQLFAQTLQQADQRGLLAAQQASLDGSTFEANASRHRLVNSKQLAKRMTALESTCKKDAAGQVDEETLAYEVFPQNNDGGTLRPMLSRIAETSGVIVRELLLDAGYISGSNLAVAQEYCTF